MYIWVPLHAPGRSWLHWRHRHGDEDFQEIPQLQVCTQSAAHLSDTATCRICIMPSNDTYASDLSPP